MEIELKLFLTGSIFTIVFMFATLIVAEMEVKPVVQNIIYAGIYLSCFTTVAALLVGIWK